MAVDKLVDSTQLDADLTSVANAIRTKGGTSAQLAFPSGFVSAIDAIPSGGGTVDWEGLVADEYINTDVTITASTFSSPMPIRSVSLNKLTLPNYVTPVGSWGRESKWKEVYAPELTGLGQYGLRGNTRLTKVYLPKVVDLGSNFGFESCSSLTVLALPSLAANLGASSFAGCTALTAADLASPNIISTNVFLNDRNLATVIIRKSTVVPLDNIAAFNGTPFASGGTGGTIYIPKALYDHLGDGTSLDYKAATNWSTIDGYGTITWAKIEGSQYENYYVDGTPVSS